MAATMVDEALPVGHCAKCDKFSASRNRLGLCEDCAEFVTPDEVFDEIRGEAYWDAEVHVWLQVVKRSRMPQTAKLVALILATYADPDGSNVYPGIARLAVQAGLSYRQVQRHIAYLRSVQLLEQTKRRNGRRGWNASYRLVAGPDAAKLADVLAPDEEAAAIELVSEQNRARYRRHYAKTKRRADGVSPENQTPSSDVDQTPSATRLPAETKHRPSMGPTLTNNLPYIADGSVIPPTGGRQPAAAALDKFDVRSRNGTSRAARAQADALTAWQLEQDQTP